MGEEERVSKRKKTWGPGERLLITERALEDKKAKQVMQRQSLIIFHSQINTKLVPKQNMANRNKSPLFPFYFRARCYMAWNISLVNSGSPPGHIPSQLPAYPPAYVLEEQGEKQTRPQCCANTVQQQLKHQHVNSIVLVTHIEHRTM